MPSQSHYPETIIRKTNHENTKDTTMIGPIHFKDISSEVSEIEEGVDNKFRVFMTKISGI